MLRFPRRKRQYRRGPLPTLPASGEGAQNVGYVREIQPLNNIKISLCLAANRHLSDWDYPTMTTQTRTSPSTT